MDDNASYHYPPKASPKPSETKANPPEDASLSGNPKVRRGHRLTQDPFYPDEAVRERVARKILEAGLC